MIPALASPIDPHQPGASLSGASFQAADFADALSRASSLGGQRDQLAVAGDMTPRQAAEELVATAFVKPILASMREMSQAAAPFAPTHAEKQFAPLLDAIFAQQIVRSGRFGLVDAVARQVQGAASAHAAQGNSTGAAGRLAEHPRHAIINTDIHAGARQQQSR